MKKAGFTLVELLTAAAIIATLAAVIMPVVIQSKEAARMRVCASNLKQLGSAILRYAEDHDGYGLPAPPQQYRNPWILCPNPLVPEYIPQSVEPYADALQSSVLPYPSIAPEERPKWLWVCPGDTNRGSAELERPCWWNFGSSFRYPGPRAYLSGERYMQRTNLTPRKITLWKNPNRDILLADHFDDFHNGSRAERRAGEDSLFSPTWIKIKCVNLLFLDLHVSAVTPGQRNDYQRYTVEDDNPYFKPSL
ncbi:MAG: prepilin-type N-terminal cleavage/methylation domain-containing protein [Armatimonadota bacterium]|nr:prepilin-type N-terminal cleavage/methylation domain-containing protein [Armatimonadota bacterium]